MLRVLICAAVFFGSLAPQYAEAQRRRGPPAGELVQEALRNQLDMVASASARLLPQRPGTRDVYFLGVAGWGDQPVFRREVQRVQGLFDTSFGTKGRSLALINNLATLKQAPMATRYTIGAILTAIGKAMDPEEDLLVLFMTSHGVQGYGLSLEMSGRSFGPLAPADLARMLDTSGIRNRVVIISACYSGQFVPSLLGENTLIMTAATFDRPSFGCTAAAEWTWFGRAYFVDALPKSRRFVPAFERAKALIEQRERRARYRPSMPQIEEGEGIRKVLDELGL